MSEMNERYKALKKSIEATGRMPGLFDIMKMNRDGESGGGIDRQWQANVAVHGGPTTKEEKTERGQELQSSGKDSAAYAAAKEEKKPNLNESKTRTKVQEYINRNAGKSPEEVKDSGDHIGGNVTPFLTSSRDDGYPHRFDISHANKGGPGSGFSSWYPSQEEQGYLNLDATRARMNQFGVDPNSPYFLQELEDKRLSDQEDLYHDLYYYPTSDSYVPEGMQEIGSGGSKNDKTEYKRITPEQANDILREYNRKDYLYYLKTHRSGDEPLTKELRDEAMKYAAGREDVYKKQDPRLVEAFNEDLGKDMDGNMDDLKLHFLAQKAAREAYRGRREKALEALKRRDEGEILDDVSAGILEDYEARQAFRHAQNQKWLESSNKAKQKVEDNKTKEENAARWNKMMRDSDLSKKLHNSWARFIVRDPSKVKPEGEDEDIYDRAYRQDVEDHDVAVKNLWDEIREMESKYDQMFGDRSYNSEFSVHRPTKGWLNERDRHFAEVEMKRQQNSLNNKVRNSDALARKWNSKMPPEYKALGDAGRTFFNNLENDPEWTDEKIKEKLDNGELTTLFDYGNPELSDEENQAMRVWLDQMGYDPINNTFTPVARHPRQKNLLGERARVPRGYGKQNLPVYQNANPAGPQMIDDRAPGLTGYDTNDIESQEADYMDLLAEDGNPDYMTAAAYNAMQGVGGRTAEDAAYWFRKLMRVDGDKNSDTAALIRYNLAKMIIDGDVQQQAPNELRFLMDSLLKRKEDLRGTDANLAELYTKYRKAISGDKDFIGEGNPVAVLQRAMDLRMERGHWDQESSIWLRTAARAGDPRALIMLATETFRGHLKERYFDEGIVLMNEAMRNAKARKDFDDLNRLRNLYNQQLPAYIKNRSEINPAAAKDIKGQAIQQLRNDGKKWSNQGYVGSRYTRADLGDLTGLKEKLDQMEGERNVSEDAYGNKHSDSDFINVYKQIIDKAELFGVSPDENQENKDILGEAYSKLSRAYARGAGVDQDEDRAFRYAMKAVDLGNDDALMDIGYQLELADPAQAVEFYSKAYQKNPSNARAGIEVAKAYIEGKVVEQDFGKVLKITNALVPILGNVDVSTSPTPKEAKKNILRGEVQNLRGIARYLSEEGDPEKNHALAETYFREAAKAGNQDAIQTLAENYTDRADKVNQGIGKQLDTFQEKGFKIGEGDPQNIDALKQQFESNPDDFGAGVSLAEAYLKSGDKQGWNEAFNICNDILDRISQLRSGDPNAINQRNVERNALKARAYNVLGLIKYEGTDRINSNPADAERLLSEAVKLKPKDSMEMSDAQANLKVISDYKKPDDTDLDSAQTYAAQIADEGKRKAIKNMINDIRGERTEANAKVAAQRNSDRVMTPEQESEFYQDDLSTDGFKTLREYESEFGMDQNQIGTVRGLYEKAMRPDEKTSTKDTGAMQALAAILNTQDSPEAKAEAFKWIKEAYDNAPDSKSKGDYAYDMGMMLFNSEESGENRDRGILLLREASKRGNADARTKIMELENTGDLVRGDNPDDDAFQDAVTAEDTSAGKKASYKAKTNQELFPRKPQNIGSNKVTDSDDIELTELGKIADNAMKGISYDVSGTTAMHRKRAVNGNTRSMKMLQQASDAGHAAATLKMAEVYFHGAPGVPNDPEKAKELVELANKQAGQTPDPSWANGVVQGVKELRAKLTPKKEEPKKEKKKRPLKKSVEQSEAKSMDSFRDMLQKAMDKRDAGRGYPTPYQVHVDETLPVADTYRVVSMGDDKDAIDMSPKEANCKKK